MNRDWIATGKLLFGIQTRLNYNPTDTAHLLIFKGEGYIRLSEHWVHQQESGFYSRILSNAEFVKKPF